MLIKPNSCLSCPLHQDGRGFIESDGIGSIPLLIVGESAGWNEKELGKPFIPSAQAGSILHRVLQQARIERSQIVIDNLIRCQPFGNNLTGTNYEYEAINNCRQYLEHTIQKYKPKIILALGNTPFKHLSGLQGDKLSAHFCRGYTFRYARDENIIVIPSYHPSFIRRGNMHLMYVLLHDVIKAKNIALGKDKNYILDPYKVNITDSMEYLLDVGTEIHGSLGYITNPTEEDALYLLKQIQKDPSLLVTYDIETEKTAGEEEDELEEYGNEITQIQFSTMVGSGIAFPFKEPFISISKRILETKNPKAGHNVWDFDNPIINRAGIQINGRIDDTMWMAHHYQADVPIGLQYTASFSGFPFAWKHFAGTNLPFYGIADVTSVQYIMNDLPKKMKDRGIWEGYDKYVYNLKPILVSIQNRGLPINREKQLNFSNEISIRQQEILEELKQHIPDSLIKLNKEHGYVREPKDVQQAKLKYMIEQGSSNAIAPEEYITEQTGYMLREFIVGDTLTKKEQELAKLGVKFPDKESRIEKRWVKLLDFNPNSSDQISNYIKWKGDEELARKLTVNIKKELEEIGDGKKKKDNVSTAKLLLKKLAEKTGNNIYSLIVEYKELTKMQGAFIEGWKPKEDGRVHTTFTFRPASGQLSSRGPNIQQGPQHTQLAEKFKETIEAKEGHVLGSFDYRGYHNKMMGFLAKDEAYLRIASLDTHSFVTGHVLELEGIESCLQLNDEYLSLYLNKIKKAFKKLRDDQIKHVVHGINFGLSEEGCYKRYKDDFDPTQEVVLADWNHRKHNPDDIYKDGETWLSREIELRGKRKVTEVYNIVKKLFPKIFKWQEETIVEADKRGYLQTPYGARRWFLAASEIKYNKYGKVIGVKKGEQAEQALAFPVSNNAHYHMRENMLILSEIGLDEEARLVNCIHDSLVFEMPEDKYMELSKRIVDIMERKSEVLKNEIMLEGFWCNVDGKVGKNLREVEELKL